MRLTICLPDADGPDEKLDAMGEKALREGLDDALPRVGAEVNAVEMGVRPRRPPC